MADLDYIITVRLLSAIDDQEWHEQAIAKRLRADEDKALFAVLFDRAAAFWGELGLVVESRRVPTRDQSMAIAWLRGPIEHDVMAQSKRKQVAA